MTGATLWVNPFNGIAGDMMLGALIDVGADVARIELALGGLDLDGWTLELGRVDRHGVSATNLSVAVTEGQPERRASEIMDLIRNAPLPERVIDRATAVFTTLAHAEGAVHDQDPGSVHFHEVGGVDAIVDVVGTCVALEMLDVDRMVVGSIAVGHGSIRTAHGMMPNPAPATAELLKGWPVVGVDTTIELTTPTGAAIVAALGESGTIPPMRITGSGFGAGDAEPAAFPNVVHVMMGESQGGATEHLVVVETNVDDATGETLAHAVERLLDCGALDAWITPVLMKKGRPAHVVSVLSPPTRVESLASVLLGETGSIGYRVHSVDRSSQPRRTESVEIDGHRIRLKITPHTAKAEHDDVASAATALNRPAREIAARAEAIWRSGDPEVLP